MNEPLTVGLIAHNEEVRIGKCLLSLGYLKKYIPDFFLVIVDNNSADNTIDKAYEAAESLNVKFQIIKRKDNHLAEARNDIIKASATRWIYMLDADCYLDESTWPQLVKDWEDNPQIAARAGSQRFPSDSEFLILLDLMRKNYLGHFGSAQMKKSGGRKNVEHVSTTHVLFDKFALQKVGGFDSRLSSSAEDLDLSLRLRKSGFLLQFIPDSFLWHGLAQNEIDWARKAFRNGVWQTRLIFYNLEILKTRRPWPAFTFFIFLLMPWPVLVSLVSLYLFIILFLSMKNSLSYSQKVRLFLLFLMTHLLYGTGELIGLFWGMRDLIFDAKLPSSTKI